MSESFDILVISGGVVGASTAYHLAALADQKIALIDRSQICSGGTARSCAIVRTHYSVPSNTALAVKSLEMFADFADYLDEPEADSGFVQSGYLILASEGEMSDKLTKNMRMQTAMGAETYPISAEVALERHPLLDLEGIGGIGYEPRSGYADPYLTTTGFVRASRGRGVSVMTDRRVRGLMTNGPRITGIETDRGAIHAACIVSAIGPWTRDLTDPLGIETYLEVSRHIVLTLRSDEGENGGAIIPH